MTAAERILGRLERVKQTGPESWIASCPTSTHPNGDRSRGLSVRMKEDGVLIYCHAGCGAADIVAALGFTLADLFDRPRHAEKYTPATRSRIPSRDLLEIIAHETTVATLIANDLVTRRTVNEAQVQRLALAAGRIAKARDHAR